MRCLAGSERSWTWSGHGSPTKVLVAFWLLPWLVASGWSEPQPGGDKERGARPRRLSIREHNPRTAPEDFFLPDPVTHKRERRYLIEPLTDRRKSGVFPASANALGVVTKTSTGRQMHVWTPLGVELWADSGKGYEQVVQRAWFEVEVWDGQKWVVAPRRGETIAISRSERNVPGGALVDLRAEGKLEGLAEGFVETGVIGFDGRRYQHKFSFHLPASTDGRRRRVIWKVKLARGMAGLIRESVSDYRVECGRGIQKGKRRRKLRPVRLRLGKLSLGWASAVRVPIGGQERDRNGLLPRVALAAPRRTVSVYFEEGGTTGAISIDPTLSITTDSATITVDDGVRKWVWVDEPTKPTVAEFYHVNVGGGWDNCASTLGHAYSCNLDSSDTFSLVVSTPTVARVHRRCTGSYGNATVETWQTVWASGRCYSELNWQRDPGSVDVRRG